jgi:cell division protein FtsL
MNGNGPRIDRRPKKMSLREKALIALLFVPVIVIPILIAIAETR